jgi:hypothetical protein
MGDEYEAEFQVPLLLGPDGKVWAEIGEVEDLPFLAERDRETLAARILDEFPEACDDGETDPDDGNPSRAALRTWPVSRVMHWLQLPTTMRRADPAKRRLITGLLGELPSWTLRLGRMANRVRWWCLPRPRRPAKTK